MSTRDDSPVTDALEKALLVQATEKLALGEDYGPGTHVVCNETSRSYHPDTLYDLWVAMCRKAGVRRIRLHDARHTRGTLMHLQGVPIAVIAAWLGHVDRTFTMRTYVHSQNAELFAAAKTLDGVVTNRDQTAVRATRHRIA
jgi:integrase